MFGINTADDVPGHIFSSQMDHIRSIASSLPKGSKVLEIGCAWGRSTWCWLDELPEGSTLTVVDPFLFGRDGQRIHKHKKRQSQYFNNTIVNEIMDYWVIHGPQKTWESVISEHPKKNMIKQLYVGSSRSFAEENDETWNCVYLDGDHRYKHINRDLLDFEPRTDIICGDDYEPETQKDVIRAVDEMIARSGRKFWLDTDSVFWTATKN